MHRSHGSVKQQNRHAGITDYSTASPSSNIICTCPESLKSLQRPDHFLQRPPTSPLLQSPSNCVRERSITPIFSKDTRGRKQQAELHGTTRQKQRVQQNTTLGRHRPGSSFNTTNISPTIGRSQRSRRARLKNNQSINQDMFRSLRRF